MRGDTVLLYTGCPLDLDFLNTPVTSIDCHSCVGSNLHIKEVIYRAR